MSKQFQQINIAYPNLTENVRRLLSPLIVTSHKKRVSIGKAGCRQRLSNAQPKSKLQSQTQLIHKFFDIES